MIIYTRQSSGRRKKRAPSKRLVRARLDHHMFVDRMIGPDRNSMSARPVAPFPDLSVKPMPPTSDNLYTTGGFKRTVDDWKWRKERQETSETIKEIERKKTRTAPLYNKGGYQYITDGEDTKTLGRKV